MFLKMLYTKRAVLLTNFREFLPWFLSNLIKNSRKEEKCYEKSAYA